MNQLTIKALVKKLTEAKDYYYNNDPIMDDEDFDRWEDALKQLDPDNDYFKVVGSPVSQGNNKQKVKHLYPMLSMAKGKSIEDIEKWLVKSFNNRYEFCITPKYDGLSFTAKYNQGKLVYLSTRGTGLEGQDITNKVKYITNIPKVIIDNRELEIRGELILEKQYSDYFKNKPLRNICVGLINRKENFEDLKYIKSVAYNVIGIDFNNEREKYEFLENNNWKNISMYQICSILKDIEQIYTEWENRLRNEFEYEVDGLVLTINNCNIQKQYIGRAEHHYDYQMALKFTPKSKKTKLLGIKWDVSKNGNVIPTAFFEPIFIQGRQIKNASLSNYKNVINMKLEINDELLIILAGDVIPYIEENITKGIKQR